MSMLMNGTIFSLWAVSPRKFGGLSYTTESVGEVLAISVTFHPSSPTAWFEKSAESPTLADLKASEVPK
ncbi:hypothetical protein RJ639_022565 [Escallonia herrerae]|uniref:Uncharacterized protein n=1 Tax=Escallonia herrerae TaxID=1293975 RepID=A0AA88V5R1_9ASTE|nr:hypothetical protein RJ639_022565 [Escallonia herrerae]